jgi:Protein kinase domain/Galactose oxidase, central domain
MESGSRLGPYEIVSKLGSGGMGAVYLARHVELDRQVALKVLPPELLGPEALLRFEREARATARLSHPNIVGIHELGTAGRTSFLALELVEGESLQARLNKAGPLEPREATSLMATVSRAMAYAHEQGVLHRDLKPDNVLVDAGGQVRVTDFGLGRIAGEAQRRLTQTGDMLGTPAFAPPEQLVSSSGEEPGPAADVYGLGATLFALLTGRPPFQGSSALGVAKRVLAEAAPAPSSLQPQVDAALDRICRRCLAKEPRERYPSAAALADDLETWSVAPRGRRRVWPRLVLVAAASVVVALLAVSSWSGRARAPSEELGGASEDPTQPVARQPQPPSHDDDAPGAWAGPAWRVVAGPGPSARWGHAMAYDPARGVVLHGGRVQREWFDDVWIWDGELQSWARDRLPGPRRSNHRLVYDERDQGLVLLGGIEGQDPGGGPLWIVSAPYMWGSTGWEPLPGDTQFAGRFNHTMTYDDHGGRLIVAGGASVPGVGALSDAWSWRDGEWSFLTLGDACILGSPGAVDPDTRRPLRFGGLTYDTLGVFELHDGIFDLVGTQWVERPIEDPLPPARLSGCLVTARDRLVLYGGRVGRMFGSGGSGEILTDTWFCRRDRWKQLEGPGPSPREGMAAAYDPVRDQVLLFGGHDADGEPLADTWILELSPPG